MFNHKEGCKFKDFYNTVCDFDHNADSQMIVSESGIEYDYNIHTIDHDEDFEIVFEFCPCCGVPKI